MKHVYPNLDNCNPNRKPKISILFDYMISEILSHKKPEQTVTELFILFIHCSKLNISNVFNKQSYFRFQHNFRLNSKHYFIMKILNKLLNPK